MLWTELPIKFWPTTRPKCHLNPTWALNTLKYKIPGSFSGSRICLVQHKVTYWPMTRPVLNQWPRNPFPTSTRFSVERLPPLSNIFTFYSWLFLGNRVATKLENLEYTGISLNMENTEFSGNSVNSVQPRGKIVTEYFRSSFKYLCKTAVDWVNRIIMTLDEGHYYVYFLLE